MANEKDKRSERVGREGRGPSAGKAIKPTELPEDEPEASSRHTSVPIGIPISRREYRDLKKKAETEKPLSGGKARPDPQADSNN